MHCAQAERYGKDLIGPPTFEEYFSIGLQDLLLSPDNEMPDRHELFLESDEGRVKINDYWIDWHVHYPRDNWTDYSTIAEQRRGFYGMGHIPILKLAIQSGSVSHTGEEARRSLFVCRPKDVIKPSLADNIFLKGLPQKILEGSRTRIIEAPDRIELSNPLQDPVVQEAVSNFK